MGYEYITGRCNCEPIAGACSSDWLWVFEEYRLSSQRYHAAFVLTHCNVRWKHLPEYQEMLFCVTINDDTVSVTLQRRTHHNLPLHM